MRVEGAWEKPTFTPDLKSVAAPSRPAKRSSRSARTKIAGSQDAIRGLLGGGDGQQKVKPRDLLEKLLKKD